MRTYRDVFLTPDGIPCNYNGHIFLSKPKIAGRRALYGRAINNYNFTVTTNSPRVTWKPYAIWGSVVQRVYDEKYHNKRPTYKQCTIDTNWLLFSNFLEWLFSQKFISTDCQIDKDILSEGKCYGPETCVMVPPWVNAMTIDSGASRGDLPLGVTRHGNSFRSSVNTPNKKIVSPHFVTIKEAEIWYHNNKQVYLDSRKLDLDVIDIRLYPNLCRILSKRREEACISLVL